MAFTEIAGARADMTKRELSLHAIDESGKEIDLRFAATVLGNLIAALLSEGGKIEPGVYSQLLTLTGAAVFSVPASTQEVGLEFQFLGGLRQRVKIHRNGIPVLKKALDAAHAQGTPRHN
jgi:hypothetical protein